MGQRRENVFFGVAILVLFAGILIGLTWDTIVESKVLEELVLTNTSKTYESWIETRIPVYISFYFWNWTNGGDFYAKKKPTFSETGPYVFREITEKVGVIWNANGTISYKRRRKWYYEPTLSKGSLDDQITTVNIVAQSAAFITRHMNILTRRLFGVGVSTTQTMSITKPVREMLFEGFTSSLIDTAQRLPGFSQSVPFDRFGWFYKRNGSEEADGVFNVETGANGMQSFGAIRRWNYDTHTSYFEDECSEIKGSGGDFFPPKRTKEDTIQMFSPDLCRYVDFKFEKETEVKGIKGYQYNIQPTFLTELDKCFCQGECPPRGALNVSTCRLGAPAFVSFPHFGYADPSYLNALEGMKFDPKRHASFIILEPTYGIPLNVSVSFQVNLHIISYPHVGMFDNIQSLYFPMMWFRQDVTISSETVDVIKMLLSLSPIGHAVSIVIIIVGATLLLIIGLRKWRRNKIKSHREFKLTNADSKTRTTLLNGNQKETVEIVNFNTQL